MKNLRDFEISDFFDGESFSSLGSIREIKEEGDTYTFTTARAVVKVTVFRGTAVKVEVSADGGDRRIEVPHSEPNPSDDGEYSIRLPEKGERFHIDISKNNNEILSTYAPGNQLGFLSLGDEFYENVTVDTERNMSRVSFRIPSEYGIYGLGENFTTFSKRGRTLYTFPHDNYCLGAEEVYKGVPFFVSNAGAGIVFPEYLPAKFDFGQTMDGLIMATVPSASLTFYILLGTPLQIAGTFLRMFGTPEMPPDWSFGMWVSRWAGIGYRSTEEVSGILEKFTKHRIPLDVITLDPQWLQDYIPGVTQACEFRWDRSNYSSDSELGDFLGGHGKKLCLWVNPYVLVGGETARKMDKCLLRDSKGNIAVVPNQDKNPDKPDRAMIDFTSSHCSSEYSKLIADLMDRSHADAVMSDFGETVPPDALDSDGNPGYLIRNRQGDLYQKASFDGVKEARGTGMVWGRSGSLLSHNYPIQWGGDSNSSWEGMRTALRAALSASMSGTLFTSFDTGGFAGLPSRELYLRWAGMGALFSHFKLHGTTPREPWEYGEEATADFGELVRLRYSLLPYILSEAGKCISGKYPFIRPPVMDYPDDRGSMYVDDEYMFGSSILVAPIFSESGKRAVYLPPGKWTGFYTREVMEGPAWINAQQPLSRVPLYVRTGSSIEMAEGYGDSVPEVLRLPVKKVRF